MYHKAHFAVYNCNTHAYHGNSYMIHLYKPDFVTIPKCYNRRDTFEPHIKAGRQKKHGWWTGLFTAYSRIAWICLFAILVDIIFYITAIYRCYINKLWK